MSSLVSHVDGHSIDQYFQIFACHGMVGLQDFLKKYACNFKEGCSKKITHDM